jgi:hypothetical protein
VLVRVVVLLVAAQSLLFGTEMFTWHSIETPVLQTSRFELNVHQRVRTRHKLEQIRREGILRWTAWNGVAVSTRLVAERHIGTGLPDYNRYRSSVRIVVGKSRIAPFFQNEMLAVRQGFPSTRNSGGMRLRINQQLTVEAGYLYDNRRVAWGGNRQALVTTVRWVPKSLLRH